MTKIRFDRFDPKASTETTPDHQYKEEKKSKYHTLCKDELIALLSQYKSVLSVTKHTQHQ